MAGPVPRMCAGNCSVDVDRPLVFFEALRSLPLCRRSRRAIAFACWAWGHVKRLLGSSRRAILRLRHADRPNTYAIRGFI